MAVGEPETFRQGIEKVIKDYYNSAGQITPLYFPQRDVILLLENQREQIAQEIEANLSSIPERDEYYFGFGDGWTDASSKAAAIARGKK